MAAILPFILRYWKLAGVLIIVFGIMLAVKNSQIASRDRTIERQGTQIAALNRDLIQCRASVTTLQAGVEAQNRAVSEQQRAAAARVAELEQSLSTARKSAQDAQSRAAAVLARRPGPDQCADALALIRGN